MVAPTSISRLIGLIPAAGSGSRFGGALPKQYVEILGEPLLVHAVRALAADRRVETVYIVLAPDDERFRTIDWRNLAPRVVSLYCGGGSRRDSVHNGLIAVSDAIELDDWVLVHDAARPCLGATELTRLIDSAREGDGGLLAIPVADTLKRADAARCVVSTEPRADLWQAQTPQLFQYGQLLRALGAVRSLSAAEAERITDESSAVERLGARPRLVLGAPTNLKITFDADLAIAAGILHDRRQREAEIT